MKINPVLVLLAASVVVSAQTKVNLGAQSKNVDFSQAPTVVPFPVGSSLPSACSIGQVFFRSTAAAGSNVYGCVATNTWALEGGGSSGGTSATLPLPVQQTNGTTLSIGLGCSGSNPCLARIGSIVYNFLAPSTATLTSGSGTVFIYIDGISGLETVGIASSGNPGITCSDCTVVTGVTQFPPFSIPLASWVATGATWASTGTDSRAILSAGPTVSSGPNISLTQTPGNMLIASGTSTSGACGVSTAGTFLYTPGIAGVKDSFAVCAKDASNNYAFRALY